MKAYQVLKDPNPKLKEIAQEVVVFDDALRETVSRMLATMRREGGIGLAGNQVGILQRIIVIDTLKSDKTNGFFGALINPTIMSFSKESSIGAEGCLSFPKKAYYVERNKEITVSFKNLMGIEQKRKFAGLTAVCIQHEIDHLNGITFDTKSIV